MRVSRERAAANRAALVRSARRLFRQHGFAAVSVSMIARDAGLTAGAFYGHFDAKREIEVLAIASMIEKAAADWQEVVQQNPSEPLTALVNGYLAHDHLSEGDVGCAFAALGADLARADPEVQAAAAQSLPLQLKVLQDLFLDSPVADRERKALAAYAALVGAATLARSLDDKRLVQETCVATAQLILSMR